MSVFVLSNSPCPNKTALVNGVQLILAVFLASTDYYNGGAGVALKPCPAEHTEPSVGPLSALCLFVNSCFGGMKGAWLPCRLTRVTGQLSHPKLGFGLDRPCLITCNRCPSVCGIVLVCGNSVQLTSPFFFSPTGILLFNQHFHEGKSALNMPNDNAAVPVHGSCSCCCCCR